MNLSRKLTDKELEQKKKEIVEQLKKEINGAVETLEISYALIIRFRFNSALVQPTVVIDNEDLRVERADVDFFVKAIKQMAIDELSKWLFKEG